MSVKVEFIPWAGSHEDLAEFLLHYKQYHPVPAVKTFTEGFKKLGTHVVENPDEGALPYNTTVKRCVPFVEAMSTGWVIPAHMDYRNDIDHVNKNMRIVINPQTNEQPVGRHHPEQAPHIFEERDVGHGGIFKWINPWIIKTPPGYSCLLVHPLNRGSKEVTFFSGIVDTDTYTQNIHLPFYINKGYNSFTFRAGDPIVQIIPFKRDNFKSVVRDFTDKEKRKMKANSFLATHIWNDVYRKFSWHKRKEK